MFILPDDPQERKKWPLATFLRDYFPDALAYLAHLSWVGNEQHNRGEPMHWAREKSMDHDEALMRHFLQAGEEDTDGILHSAKCAWRSLAMLQLELEARHEKEPQNETAQPVEATSPPPARTFGELLRGKQADDCYWVDLRGGREPSCGWCEGRHAGVCPDLAAKVAASPDPYI